MQETNRLSIEDNVRDLWATFELPATWDSSNPSDLVIHYAGNTWKLTKRENASLTAYRELLDSFLEKHYEIIKQKVPELFSIDDERTENVIENLTIVFAECKNNNQRLKELQEAYAKEFPDFDPITYLYSKIVSDLIQSPEYLELVDRGMKARQRSNVVAYDYFNRYHDLFHMPMTRQVDDYKKNIQKLTDDMMMECRPKGFIRYLLPINQLVMSCTSEKLPEKVVNQINSFLETAEKIIDTYKEYLNMPNQYEEILKEIYRICKNVSDTDEECGKKLKSNSDLSEAEKKEITESYLAVLHSAIISFIGLDVRASISTDLLNLPAEQYNNYIEISNMMNTGITAKWESEMNLIVMCRKMMIRIKELISL